MPGDSLEFAWDPVKAASNLTKHGVTFAQAATVFTDALALTVFDDLHSSVEERWFTLGMDSRGDCLPWPTLTSTQPQARHACASSRLGRPVAKSAGSTKTCPADAVRVP